MKKLILFISFLIFHSTTAQVFTTNRNPVGLEHNILFNAQLRYQVTQQGPALSVPSLFDGGMAPSYSNGNISYENPTVILIENLPSVHTQVGAWVGWTTRYWYAKRFKIEGYDEYNSFNNWKVIADYSSTDYNNYDFSVQIPGSGVFTKLKFTFYVSETNGQLGVSELFFIHPEATYPYAGLLSYAINNWEINNANLVYNKSGNVGIGTTSPTSKLTVAGDIASREVKVSVDAGADFVFEKNYLLPSLESVEKFIKENNHLPEIASAEEMKKDGINLSQMNIKLLQKMEEMTLYMIEQNKRLDKVEKENIELKRQISSSIKKN